MKKMLLSLIGVLLFTAATTGTSIFAAEAKQYKAEMMSAINEQLKEEYSDYKNGTLQLADVKFFEVSAEESEIKNVVAGMATFKTVRDNFFAFTHREVVFYDVDAKKALSLSEVAIFDSISKYQEAHKSETGKFMHFSVIMLLLSTIILVPLYFMTIWSKRQYSTTAWTTPNNIYGNQQTFH